MEVGDVIFPVLRDQCTLFAPIYLTLPGDSEQFCHVSGRPVPPLLRPGQRVPGKSVGTGIPQHRKRQRPARVSLSLVSNMVETQAGGMRKACFDVGGREPGSRIEAGSSEASLPETWPTGSPRVDGSTHIPTNFLVEARRKALGEVETVEHAQGELLKLSGALHC